MCTPNYLRIKILAILLLCLGTIVCAAQCNNIDAEAKVVNDPGTPGSKATIRIEFKSGTMEAFKISLFGPDKKNVLNVEKTSFDNLPAGKYLIVIVGKRDDDNYCPKSINVTVNL